MISGILLPPHGMPHFENFEKFFSTYLENHSLALILSPGSTIRNFPYISHTPKRTSIISQLEKQNFFASSLRKLCFREIKTFEILVSEYSE